MAIRGTYLSRLSALVAMFPFCAWADDAPVPTARATTLAEIIVTARKVEEHPRDVPMSVQVLAGEFLDESSTTRLQELQFAVPGLVINSTGLSGAGFSLRGVADQRVAGLTVAPHLNGVYLGDANVALARMFDIERIEVLKGPQGTLYGGNSTGGSVNVITRAPQDQRAAEVALSLGSFETSRAQGYLNLPFSNAALRLAFITSKGDGYIRNTIDGRRFGQEDYWGFRGSLRLAAGDSGRLDLMAQHVRDDGGSGDLWTPSPEFLPDPGDIRLTTVTLEDPYLVSEIDNVDLRFEYEFATATLRSISGYAQSHVRNVDDCAGTPVLQGCVRSALPNDFKQWSQELQLVFPRSGALEGIIGAFASDGDSQLDFYQLLPLVNAQPLTDKRTTSSNTAYALFGQATFHIADGWRASAGLRWSREEQRSSTIGIGFQDSHTLQTNSNDFDKTSWRLDLSRAIGEDRMFYASVSTGYKSGGFVLTTPANGVFDNYGPEQLTAFEFGAKSRWREGRLSIDAAAFYYDYEDLQVSTTTIVADRIVVGVDNAAQARLYGIDTEMSFEISPRWSVSGGLVWLPKREFVEYENEVTGDTLSGNDLIRAPQWSALGSVRYERPVGDRGRLSAKVEYSYRSGYYYTPENDPDLAQDGFGLLNAQLRFEAASGAWYLFASGRNLTDEDYFNQILLQSSPGYPDTYEVGVGIRF